MTNKNFPVTGPPSETLVSTASPQVEMLGPPLFPQQRH